MTRYLTGPQFLPNKARKYTGAGSQHFDASSDEETSGAVSHRGWRPGQPPRGDVVVKLTKEKIKPVIDNANNHSNAASKVTNKVLSSEAVISSKVPTTMNDKYSIPGLFIKPSTKTVPASVKPVEARLTLSPVEGTMSLTTKLVADKQSSGYQSSIFTPSKSPVLEPRPAARPAPQQQPVSAVPISTVRRATISCPHLPGCSAGNTESIPTS